MSQSASGSSASALLAAESVRLAARARFVGATPESVDYEFRWVVQEVLRRSLVWRVQFDVTTVAGTALYTLPLDVNHAVVAVTAARINDGGGPLKLGDVSLLDTEEGRPGRVGMGDFQSVLLNPVPDNAYAVIVEVALTLTPDTESDLPDVLVPYHAALLSGLLYRMYAMPNKPYTNAQAAQHHLLEFNKNILDVKRDAVGQRAVGSRIARPLRKFA
jgi:hypothetical protein